jgi:hypothetical protein
VAILEKAWIKVLGNIKNYNDQVYGQNALRALTGAPVFTYQTSGITNAFYQNLVFDLIFLSMESPQYYPVIAMTEWDRDDPSMTSSCNILENYASEDVTDHSAIKSRYLINYSFSLLKAVEVLDSSSAT